MVSRDAAHVKSVEFQSQPAVGTLYVGIHILAEAKHLGEAEPQPKTEQHPSSFFQLRSFKLDRGDHGCCRWEYIPAILGMEKGESIQRILYVNALLGKQNPPI